MSKKIENPSMQAVIYFVAVLILSLILWPLLDLFWCSVLIHTEFHYDPKDYIIEPLVFAVFMTAVFYIPQIVKYNKSKKKPAKKAATKESKKK